MHPVEGIQLGTICRHKSCRSKRLVLMQVADGATTAAVFTQNKFCAAPVIIAKQHLQRYNRVILINTGNANAGTGEQGIADSLAVAKRLLMQQGLINNKYCPFLPV